MAWKRTPSQSSPKPLDRSYKKFPWKFFLRQPFNLRGIIVLLLTRSSSRLSLNFSLGRKEQLSRPSKSSPIPVSCWQQLSPNCFYFLPIGNSDDRAKSGLAYNLSLVGVAHNLRNTLLALRAKIDDWSWTSLLWWFAKYVLWAKLDSLAHRKWFLKQAFY